MSLNRYKFHITSICVPVVVGFILYSRMEEKQCPCCVITKNAIVQKHFKSECIRTILEKTKAVFGYPGVSTWNNHVFKPFDMNAYINYWNHNKEKLDKIYPSGWVSSDHSNAARRYGESLVEMPAVKVFSSIQSVLALLIDDSTREGALKLGWGNIPKQLVGKVSQNHDLYYMDLEKSVYDIVDTRWPDYNKGIHIQSTVLMKNEIQYDAIPLSPVLETIMDTLAIKLGGQFKGAVTAEVDIKKLWKLSKTNKDALEAANFDHQIKKMLATNREAYIVDKTREQTIDINYWRDLLNKVAQNDHVSVQDNLVVISSHTSSDRQILRIYEWRVKNSTDLQTYWLEPIVFYEHVPFWALFGCRSTGGILIATNHASTHNCNKNNGLVNRDITRAGDFSDAFNLVRITDTKQHLALLEDNEPCWQAYLGGINQMVTSKSATDGGLDDVYLHATIPQVLSLILTRKSTLLTTQVNIVETFVSPVMIMKRETYGIGHIGDIGQKSSSAYSVGDVVIVSATWNKNNKNNNKYYLWRLSK